MPKVPEGYLHERRRHILAAASRVFSRRGVQAATMTEVAAEAGISPGLIYRYFPSKDELLSCAMSESAQEVEARWMEPPEDSPDPMGEFLDLSQRTFEVLSQPGAQQQIVLHVEHLLAAVRDEDSSAMAAAWTDWETIVDKIRARLDEGKRAGQVDPAIDTLALAQVCFQFYWGTRIRKMMDPEHALDASVDAFNEMVMRFVTPQ